MLNLRYLAAVACLSVSLLVVSCSGGGSSAKPTFSAPTIYGFNVVNTHITAGDTNIMSATYDAPGPAGITPSVGSVAIQTPYSGPYEGNAPVKMESGKPYTFTEYVYGDYTYTLDVPGSVKPDATATVTVKVECLPVVALSINTLAYTRPAGSSYIATAREYPGLSYVWTISNGTIQGSNTGTSVNFTVGTPGLSFLYCTATNPLGVTATDKFVFTVI